MKRSSGVTALAVMLIIFGLGQLVGSISQFAVGPRAAEQQIAGLKAQRHNSRARPTSQRSPESTCSPLRTSRDCAANASAC